MTARLLLLESSFVQVAFTAFLAGVQIFDAVE